MRNIVIVGEKLDDALEFHFREAFRHRGDQAQIVGLDDAARVMPERYRYWARRASNAYDERICNRLARIIVQKSPDFVVVMYRHLHPLVIQTLKARLPGVKVVHVNSDAITNLENQQVLVSPFDAWFTKEPFMQRFMKQKLGLNAHYLPESFNPRFHQKPDVPKELAERNLDLDVLVFGNLYPYRTRLIKRLVEAGVSLRMYGNRGPYFPTELDPYYRPEYITGNRKSELIYGARIVFNNMHYAEIEAPNLKFFEINGMMGFQVCDNKPTLDDYGPVTSDRYAFSTFDEALSKIEYFLRNPAERYEIAEKQYQHFLQHHTIDHRLDRILHVVDLD